MAEKFETRLTVDRSIVELLSKSTYQRNLSYALREMVSNAYDADSTRVNIDIDRQADSISIHDTGTGMTRDDFDYYLRIAGKRRGKVRTSKFGRKRIGQFGVGFLSIFPFCKLIKITTTTENSDEILSAQIPAQQFFKGGESFNVDALPVTGLLYRDRSKIKDHYTSITLQGLTDSAKAAVSNAISKNEKRRADSILDRSPFERLKWELQDELPLPFARSSPYLETFKYAESDLIQVYLNDELLYRNDLGGDLIDFGEYSYEGVKARYAITTPWKAIKPVEMRHIKVRLYNVGVGGRTDFDIARVRPYSHLSWVSGELHITDGLSEMISLSRDTFVESPAMQRLRDHMATVLRSRAAYIEKVETSGKTITKHVAQQKQREVAPTKQVVSANIKKLQDKGFTTRTVQYKHSVASEPVTIDRSKKEITVVENHPSLRDIIRIANTDYEVKYVDANSPDGHPCKLNNDGSVSVYSKYPLFRSKRYGQLFEKMCILMLIGSRKGKTAEDLQEFVLENLMDTFEDYQG